MSELPLEIYEENGVAVARRAQKGEVVPFAGAGGGGDLGPILARLAQAEIRIAALEAGAAVSAEVNPVEEIRLEWRVGGVVIPYANSTIRCYGHRSAGKAWIGMYLDIGSQVQIPESSEPWDFFLPAMYQPNPWAGFVVKSFGGIWNNAREYMRFAMVNLVRTAGLYAVRLTVDNSEQHGGAGGVTKRYGFGQAGDPLWGIGVDGKPASTAKTWGTSDRIVFFVEYPTDQRQPIPLGGA